MAAAIFLPGGWGFHPAVPITTARPNATGDVRDLPELPLLRLLKDVGERRQAVVDELLRRPGLAHVVTGAQLAKRYPSLTRAQANYCIQVARRDG